MSATDKDGATSVLSTASIVIAVATVIPIDATWIQNNGPAPYYLMQAGATYQLQTDVTVDGTAFIVLNKNITFDLNGHTITYGNSQPITVPNGGFEDGSSPTDIPHWDVSQAPGAVRMAARTGMWGSWMLAIAQCHRDRDHHLRSDLHPHRQSRVRGVDHADGFIGDDDHYLGH